MLIRIVDKQKWENWRNKEKLKEREKGYEWDKKILKGIMKGN